MTSRNEFDVTVGRQPTHALLFIKEGSFQMTAHGQECTVGAGECAIFTDDVDFSRSVISPISFVYLKFAINPRCRFALPIPFGKVVLRQWERFLCEMEEYEGLLERDDACSVYRRGLLLENMLWLICTEHQGKLEEAQAHGGEACHDALVASAQAYIKDHLAQKITLKELCTALSTNPATLNFKFRRVLSSSVMSYVLSERMRKARRLLSTTTYPVFEVARRCGYENIYYFSTAFKQNEGVSPLAFRRRSR